MQEISFLRDQILNKYLLGPELLVKVRRLPSKQTKIQSKSADGYFLAMKSSYSEIQKDLTKDLIHWVCSYRSFSSCTNGKSLVHIGGNKLDLFPVRVEAFVIDSVHK